MSGFVHIALTPYACDEGEVRETAEQDRLGRQIGGRVHRFATNMVRRDEGALPGDWRHFLRPVKGLPPSGPVFGFIPSATRNKRPYGASQPFRLFGSEAEREAAIEDYFRGVARRAAKGARR